MLKTIFVAFDGCGHANKAVEMATDIAAKFGARLIIDRAAVR